MADMSGKSYNDTQGPNATVDVTDQKELEAVRAARRDGTLGEEAPATYGSGLGERVAAHASDLAAGVKSRASGLYDEAATLAGQRAGEVTREARTMISELVETKPVHLVLGAALAGYLFGRFG
jgi:hypothetical protein